jgi:hypothetical protein
MIEAGFRHRTVSVPVDNLERLAAALIRILGKGRARRLGSRLAE